MAQTNSKVIPNTKKTHEGAPAARLDLPMQLRRTVMSCLLFEDTYYEDGIEIAERIKQLIQANDPQVVADMAIFAREDMKLRHVPLLMVRELARHPLKAQIRVADVLARVIQRADELAEFLAIYWKDGADQPLSKQVRLGLAKAFQKFSAYDLAKYNRDNTIKLRDVAFLCHPKAINKEQGINFAKLLNKTYYPVQTQSGFKVKKTYGLTNYKTLDMPDTWETALSAGESPKVEVWTRLIKEQKLGALALLRNLRNMQSVGVETDLIRKSLNNMKVDRVLPYRFISAARYAPKLEPELEQAMFKCVEKNESLLGKTLLLVDVSGSMNEVLSNKGEMTRIDAACGLAVLLREICQTVEIHTFSDKLVNIPARRGFALRDAIDKSQTHNGTALGSALTAVNYGAGFDRIIIITDEQSSQVVNAPKTKGYLINVAPYQYGVGYGPWVRITGFSEAVVQYIQAYEDLDNIKVPTYDKSTSIPVKKTVRRTVKSKSKRNTTRRTKSKTNRK